MKFLNKCVHKTLTKYWFYRVLLVHDMLFARSNNTLTKRKVEIIALNAAGLSELRKQH